jgi:hypothetical protein
MTYDIWARVDKSGDCWLWTGPLTRDGYGKTTFRGQSIVPHRIAYEELVGPIPEGLVIDHLCRVRNCVNPDHLEPVTFRENVLRGVGPAAIHAAKTHCVNGHPFDEENTYVFKRWRQCRTCNNENSRLYRQRKAVAA